MAKKKTSKANGKAGKPRLRSIKRRLEDTARKLTGAPRKAAKPRQAALPGTAQIRNKRLDHLCEEIGDARDKMNGARALEQSAIADALGEMQRTDGRAYKHAGVELARMPGGEKLRVRVTKDHGDASDSDFEPSEQGPEETLGVGETL